MSGAVVAIGNFDGVHRGHRAVLAQARRLAGPSAHKVVALTFDPHPTRVLGRTPPPQLSTLERRVELLLAHGADEVVVEPFTTELAAFTPERFARELLSARLHARAVVVGEGFRFGAKRAGDFPRLEALGAELGFVACAAEVAGDADGPFSSTRVRQAVARGDVVEAARVLGRLHELSGTVVHGDHLGRTLGFPTANLDGVVEALPLHGVYAVVAAGPQGERWTGVLNVGVRPTVDGAKLRVEAHLFDVDVDLYGARVRLGLVAHLRPERRFGGLDALKAQIAQDAQDARQALAASPSSVAAFGANKIE